MGAKKWTWDTIRASKDKMTDAELESAIGSMMPADIERITDKLGREDLTPAEEARLEAWENSPQSGVAGSLMGGKG